MSKIGPCHVKCTRPGRVKALTDAREQFFHRKLNRLDIELVRLVKKRHVRSVFVAKPKVVLKILASLPWDFFRVANFYKTCFAYFSAW